MSIISSETRTGLGEYAGIPVLEYSLSVPHLSDEFDPTKRINHFYTMLLEQGEVYCQTELTRLAGAAFERAIEHSRIFRPFTMNSSYACCEDDWQLRIQWELTTTLGDTGEFTQRWNDVWDLMSGFPVPQKQKTAGSK